ncbi:MAG TPA: deoxyribodipyrimidine photo-lyase [Cellvibrionaceae bacterium]
MKQLVWFRNDLRLLDNPALHHSTVDGEGKVLGCYLLCRSYIDTHPVGAAKLHFIRQNLLILARQLAACGIPFEVIAVNTPDEIAPAILALCQRLKVERVSFNAEYPLDEVRRDRLVTDLLRQQNIDVKRYHDRVMVPPGMLKTGKGDMYKVYTPFMRQWLTKVTTTPFYTYSAPAITTRPLKVNTQAIEDNFKDLPQKDLSALWPAGEEEALRRLKQFCQSALMQYRNDRDFPAIDGTSSLSPYLAVGVLSPKQCYIAATQSTQENWQDNESILTWVKELIWREFYTHIVAAFPSLSRHQPMQGHTRFFPWSYDKAAFKRWCEGQTGIPVIDAAMRQLNTTGWMHNRLRMVTAMFLTKNLRIHWQWGERYFMEQLIDGEFAANNGGWQWSASTGTDAAPYFRIMNPVSQSKRFDADGEFIRRYVPELKACDNKTIHAPVNHPDYPEPMVDLKLSRAETITLFKELPSSANG